jgi:hypothetical protein
MSSTCWTVASKKSVDTLETTCYVGFMGNKNVGGQLEVPVARLTSPRGRVFTLGKGERRERYPADPLWSESWPIFLGGVQAGMLYRNLSYGTAPNGLPRWQASTRQLFWGRNPTPPTGLGFDVAAFDTAAECLDAWAASADQVLDWYEGKAVPNIYSKTGVSQKMAEQPGMGHGA